MLRTLGGLVLEGRDFRRVKPLLLLSYLALEGPTPRRYLAELFWPGASDNLNSLSVALSQLRRCDPTLIDADEVRVAAQVSCDAVALLDAVQRGQLAEAMALYRGAFLEGVDLALGEELEEWLYGTRERLAEALRLALLRQAEAHAAVGDFAAAAELAERAYRLPGAAEPEPEALVRFHALLVAGKSPLAAEVRREAEAYELTLKLMPEEAQSRLRHVVLGREREITRLSALSAGEWVWLRGGPAMGKTTLLKHLAGQYLPARSGLPYATLEPLLGEVGESEALLLRRLAARRGTWLIDDWERMDPESRGLLVKLRDLKPSVTVVIASSEDPALPVDAVLELGPLPAEALEAYPGLAEQSGGLPSLVAAYLHREPLTTALEARLALLSASARRLYLALALLERPDPALVRRALDLGAAGTAAALEELLRGGLVESSGAVRARQAALDYLGTHPAEMGALALALARVLDEVDDLAAFALYVRARPLWEEGDYPAIRRAYLAWAQALLRRGFPLRAADTLAEAPPAPDVQLARARALERAGHYKEALLELDRLPDTPPVAALRGALLWRLGHPDQAEAAARRALVGDEEARAEALNTLGHLARSQGDFAQAASLARRAAALWRALGQQARWVDALNNLAVAQVLAGETREDAFAEALAAAGDNPLLRARVLLSWGWMHERRDRLAAAEAAYREAAALAHEAGAAEVAAYAHNNLGVVHHRRGQVEDARHAYETALTLTQQAGDRRMLGMVMANLAELNGDLEAWQEALAILEAAGHTDEAERYRADLPADHPFRLAESTKAPAFRGRSG